MKSSLPPSPLPLSLLLLLLLHAPCLLSQQQIDFGLKVREEVKHQPQIYRSPVVQLGHLDKRFPQKREQSSNPPIQRLEELKEDCRSGFSVRKANRTTLKARTHVQFQDVLTNAGGWDSDNQVFVAPCPGIYFFTFNAVSEEDLGFTMALMKNEKYQVTAYGGKEGYQWGSNSAMLFLNPSDIVFLVLQDGEIYEHPFEEAYTSFTGFLVNKF